MSTKKAMSKPKKKTVKGTKAQKLTKARTKAAEAAAPNAGRTRWSALSTEEIQSMYKEVVGRETTSDNRAYMIWKIREAKAGRVRVGPSLRRAAKGPQFVLSVRVDEDTVPMLDEAWRKHGLTSRNHLVHRALSRLLAELDEEGPAARFADSGAEAE